MKAITMTIGELREALKDKKKYPDDGLVLYQRIEDIYFEEHKWKSVKKDDGELPGMKDEFVHVFTNIKYRRDKNLYLTAHY